MYGLLMLGKLGLKVGFEGLTVGAIKVDRSSDVKVMQKIGDVKEN